LFLYIWYVQSYQNPIIYRDFRLRKGVKEDTKFNYMDKEDTKLNAKDKEDTKLNAKDKEDTNLNEVIMTKKTPN